MKSALFALAMAASVARAAAPGAQLLHTPVMSGSLGQDLAIQASLMGQGNNSTRVRLYYRTKGTEIFRSLEMEGATGSLEGTIPGDAVQAVGLEYYIEAAVYSGGAKTVVATYPPVNPSLVPVQVVVHQDTTPPDILVLNPTDGSVVDTTDPVLSLAINDDDSGVEGSNVDIILDGKAVASPTDGQLSPYTVPLHGLKDGFHTVVARVKDRAGNLSRLSWNFTVAATGAILPASPSGWVSSGSVGYETAYGLDLGSPNTIYDNMPYQPYGLNRGDLQVSARDAENTVSVRVHETDEERWEAQPVDRFAASWANKQGVLTVGDVSNATFSELSLYQLPELRGFEADLRSGALDGNHSRFIGLWGQTERAVEAGSTNFSGVSSTATFAQYLYGARWESGGPHFQTGWNALTVNDDQASVQDPGSQKPSYNTIISTDWRLAAPEIHLAMTAEGALDYYAAQADPTGVSFGGAYRANALWDMAPWGTKASFEWRDLGGTLNRLTSGISSKIPSIPVQGGYSSMGNPGLISDYRGFESALSQHILDGQLGVDLSYNHWHDNLVPGAKLATTTTDFVSGNLTMAPAHWPSLVFGYTENHAYNDADGSQIVQTDILSGTYSATLSYSAIHQSADQQDFATWTYNLSWTDTMVTDLCPVRSTQDLGAWNLVALAMYMHKGTGYSLSAGVGQSYSPGALLESQTITAGVASILNTPLPEIAANNLNLGAHWTDTWGQRTDSNLGWDLVQNLSDTDPTPTVNAVKLDNLRNTFSVIGGYKVAKGQRVSLQVAYAMINAVNDIGKGLGSVPDNYAELYSDFQYSMNF